jgi:hypothetical protein
MPPVCGEVVMYLGYPSPLVGGLAKPTFSSTAGRGAMQTNWSAWTNQEKSTGQKAKGDMTKKMIALSHVYEEPCYDFVNETPRDYWFPVSYCKDPSPRLSCYLNEDQ